MAVISTENLTRRFGAVTAVAGLTVSVEAGVIGLVGANGAGKSTLIKMLLGLLPPTSGRAIVLGRDVTAEGAAVRAQVGYMPEHDCLPPDVTATELVVHMARMSGLPATAARERTADTLRHVGLYEERYRPIGGYSTGMRQRVKLAQALVHDPELVLLDEPTNGLDPAGREDMLTLVQRVGADFGISVLVASHLLGELERICDHVVVMDGGQLLRSSSTADVTAVEALLVVEVDERADALVDVLRGEGLTASLVSGDVGAAVGSDVGSDVGSAGGSVEVQVRDETTVDQVRDAVAGLGLGLVRMQRRRHRMAEIFTTPKEASRVDA